MTPVPEPTYATTPTAAPTDASDPNWVTAALYAEYLDFDCASLETTDPNLAPTDEPLITCEDDGSAKYILGPVEVAGEDISDATSGLVTNSQGQSTGAWARQHRLQRRGHRAVRRRHRRASSASPTPTRATGSRSCSTAGSSPRRPRTAIITDGKPQISRQLHAGDRRRRSPTSSSSARCRSSFEVHSNETISATLGGVPAQERTHRRPHRPHPRDRLLAVPVPRCSRASRSPRSSSPPSSPTS